MQGHVVLVQKRLMFNSVSPSGPFQSGEPRAKRTSLVWLYVQPRFRVSNPCGLQGTASTMIGGNNVHMEGKNLRGYRVQP
jgi:hypothetical protein